MRIALVRHGVVENVIEAESDFLDGNFHLGDGVAAIPAQNAGPDWSHDGVTFSPPITLTPVPQSVTMFQAREILRRTPAAAGGTLLDAVNDYVDAQRLAQPTLALAWEYATQVERKGAFVTTLAGVFDLNETVLDDLFRDAASINA